MIFTKWHFPGEKEQHEKKPLSLLSPKLLLWQCQGVCPAVCETALLEPRTLCLLPTHHLSEQTQSMLPYLVLSSFPACCFQMGQNYWSHLEILWLYICRGNSGGSFPLIPSEEFMNYYCFSVQGFPMWGFFRVQYDKFGTTPDRSPAKSNIHRLKNVHHPPGTVHRPSQTSVTGWAVTQLQSPWARLKPTGQRRMLCRSSGRWCQSLFPHPPTPLPHHRRPPNLSGMICP